jgi:hypothetical protein
MNWDPDLGPQFGTPIWDPDLGPRFGTPDLGPLIWDPDLGPRFGTLFWTSIWDTPIWDPNLVLWIYLYIFMLGRLKHLGYVLGGLT